MQHAQTNSFCLCLHLSPKEKYKSKTTFLNLLVDILFDTCVMFIFKKALLKHQYHLSLLVRLDGCEPNGIMCLFVKHNN